MMAELLTILEDNKTYSIGEIAEKLNTDIATVKARIEHLEIMGYIEKSKINDNPSCSKTCFGCSGCPSDISLPISWKVAK